MTMITEVCACKASFSLAGFKPRAVERMMAEWRERHDSVCPDGPDGIDTELVDLIKQLQDSGLMQRDKP